MQSEVNIQTVSAICTDTCPSSERSASIAATMVREFRSAPIFYGLFLVFAAFSFAASIVFGDSVFGPATNYLTRLKTFIYIGGLVALVYLACNMISIKARADRKIVTNKILDATQVMVMRALSAIMTYVLFMGCFLYWKMKITWLNPFAWDIAFADMDHALFGGQSAFDALAFLQTPSTTYFLDTAYGFWGIMCVAFWVLVATLPRLPNHVRHQYWLASLMAWLIGGLVIATVFSSAGPIYFSAITGDTARFANLDQYLPQFGYDLLVNALKDMLWDVHNGQSTMFGGISAFPSMHNAQALLFVLVAAHMGRLYVWFALPFAALIFIGSLHLGWHYAVDTIAAYAITLTIWWLAGHIIGLPHSKPEPNLA